MPAELPGIFGSLEPILVSYGYLAVFGLVFIESFGVPAPSQTIIVAAAVYAGAGRLNIVGVAEADPSRPRHLITEPGMGYRFEG